LLAADQVLGSRAIVYVLTQDDASPARQALSGLGAEVVHDELSRSENYAHSWLDEARRLDSAGHAGQLATLALLRPGFNETGTCGGGDEASQRVSAVGEQLLRSVTDPAMAGELHVLVADGDADVVALAAGAGATYADSSAYTAAAPEARRRAIGHYRQGIAVAPHFADAHDAWVEAWRLLAGLPPTTTYFFGVYDWPAGPLVVTRLGSSPPSPSRRAQARGRRLDPRWAMSFSRCSQISGLMLSTSSLFLWPSITAIALVSRPAMRHSSITAVKWIRASRIMRPSRVTPAPRVPNASANR
jgi:hypothetical protein